MSTDRTILSGGSAGTASSGTSKTAAQDLPHAASITGSIADVAVGQQAQQQFAGTDADGKQSG